MRTRGLLLLATLLCSTLLLSTAPLSSAEQIENTFRLELTDNTDNDLTDPLFSNVTYHFDTFSSSNGTIYKLRAMYTLNVVPSKLTVVADDGAYYLQVKVEGMTSWAADAGLIIQLTSEENTISSELSKDNDFSQFFKDGENKKAELKPNLDYQLSLNILEDEVETPVPPETITGIKITFEATLKDGLHQIIFISESQTVESYMVPDNYVINSVPEVSERTDYEFMGWFTADGREIVPGTTVTSDDGDIIAYAKWNYIGVDPSSTVYPIVAIIVAAIIASLLLVIIIYKRKRYPE